MSNLDCWSGSIVGLGFRFGDSGGPLSVISSPLSSLINILKVTENCEVNID